MNLSLEPKWFLLLVSLFRFVLFLEIQICLSLLFLIICSLILIRPWSLLGGDSFFHELKRGECRGSVRGWCHLGVDHAKDIWHVHHQNDRWLHDDATVCLKASVCLCFICFLFSTSHHIIEVKSAFCVNLQKGLDHYFEFVA